MSDLIKKIKIKQQDGTFTDYIPIGAEAQNVSTSDGDSVQLKLNKKPYYYNSVADMKADTKLKAGDMAVTLGYYEVNDGGNGEYRIISGNYTEDNGIYHELDNHLFAELITKNHLINVKQFGVKGQGYPVDDTVALRNMFTTCRDKGFASFFFPRGKYYVTDTLLDYGIDGLSLRGENDDIYDPASTILRGADKTIFNFGGRMTLTGNTYRASDLLWENMTIRDYQNTYTDNPFVTLHYAQHYTLSNLSIACRHKALDIKHLYDSRFYNIDFTGGGDTNSALVTIHGGKHATTTEIGWDSGNCLSFIGCRWEYYEGCAIETTTEVQPDPSEWNPNYDPCIAEDVNSLWLIACRFESSTMKSGSHLKFVKTNGINLDCMITCLDGQPAIDNMVELSGCTQVYGTIKAGYNQPVRADLTYQDFYNPIMTIKENCGKIALKLLVGTVYNHYKLNYFVDLQPFDRTRNSIDIDLLYNSSKHLYEQDNTKKSLNAWKDGRIVTYGTIENGFGHKVDDTAHSFISNMSYDTTNDYYNLVNYFIKSNGNQEEVERTVSKDNFSYKRFNYPIVAVKPIMINPGQYPSSLIAQFRSSGTTSRALMYDTTYPTEEKTDVLFKRGDIIFNSTPSAGGVVGWICTTGGNPGTWKAFGNIEN